MKLLTCIILVLHSFTTKVISTIDLLVKDYLKFNNIGISLFLTCDNITERVKRKSDLQNNNVWMNFWDISSEEELRNLNYKNILVRLGSPLGVVINLECNNVVRVMEEISARKMFHYERSWLIFARNYDDAYELLRRQFINMDAEIYLAVPTNETYYQIFEVFNPSFLRGGHLNISQISYWSLGDGFSMVTWQTKIQRRHDLKGLTFHTATAIPAVPKNKTFIEHIESDEYPYIDSGDKNNQRLFRLLMDMFNFTVFVHRASVWGILSPNGTWKGVIGMLSRNEIDLAVPSFRWANERYDAFEHTTHTYHIQFVFLFLHPKSVDTSRVYLSPFDDIVWYSILFIGLIIAFALRQMFLTENLAIQTENDSTYSNTILMVFAFMFQQGKYLTEKVILVSSRALMTTVLIFAVVTFQFYSSFIVASLLTEAPKTIKTVQQLLDSNLNCFIDEVAYISDHIEHYKEESVVKLYNKITEHPNAFLPLEVGMDLVKRGGHAFYTDGNHGYQVLEKILTDQEACDLQDVKFTQKLPGGPGVPKKSPFKELIKISLRRILETGILKNHWKTWIGRKPQCAKDNVDVIPVDVLHFSSALYVPVIGAQLSLGVLLCEIIMSCYKKRIISQ